MREILFRGKRVIDGKWVESCCPLGEMHSGTVTYDFDSKTVCQYTGLTDKNGRKIFEGDICKDGDNVVRVLWNDKHQWGVEISKTDFVLSKGLIFPLWQYDKCEENGNRELEVIGNIFDNPELIGDQP